MSEQYFHHRNVVQGRGEHVQEADRDREVCQDEHTEELLQRHCNAEGTGKQVIHGP